MGKNQIQKSYNSNKCNKKNLGTLKEISDVEKTVLKAKKEIKDTLQADKTLLTKISERAKSDRLIINHEIVKNFNNNVLDKLLSILR